MEERRLVLLRSACDHGNTCPSIFYDAAHGRYAVQGLPVTEPAVLSQLNLPANETAVWLPADLLPELRQGD